MLVLLFIQSVGNLARIAFTAIAAVTLTETGLPPALEGAQRDSDVTAGTHQTRASGMCLDDQLDRLAQVSGAGQPSASSEQTASHFVSSKRRFGLGLIREKLAVSQGSPIALNVLVMNLEQLLELLFVLFATLLRLVLVNERGQSVRTLPLKAQMAAP